MKKTHEVTHNMFMNMEARRNMTRRLIRGLFIVILTIFGFLCSCTQKNGDSDRTLGEAIMIDGIDVSGMSSAAAFETLSYEHMKRSDDISVTVTSPNNGSVSFSAQSLPIEYDTQDVIDEALKLKRFHPIGNGYRVFETQSHIDAAKAAQALKGLCARLESEPKNAESRYTGTLPDKFEFTGGISGYEVDVDSLAEELAAAWGTGNEYAFEAPMIEIKPEYTLEAAKADNTLIASCTTYFDKSPHNAENRVFNIIKGAGLIDGCQVEVGSEFDINEVLGARSERNGWRMAAGIREGKYNQEYGGGICQVSTTLYNAVLMADLEVTERHHHSWPMSYAPIGLDATISTGGPNLRFVNSGKSRITISAATDSKNMSITVEVYGAPLDNGVTIRLSSEKIETLDEPDAKYRLDSSLPFNTVVRDRKGRRGSISQAYKEYYDANGKLIEKRLISKDVYGAISAIYRVSEDVYYAKASTGQSAVDVEP